MRVRVRARVRARARVRVRVRVRSLSPRLIGLAMAGMVEVHAAVARLDGGLGGGVQHDGLVERRALAWLGVGVGVRLGLGVRCEVRVRCEVGVRVRC